MTGSRIEKQHHATFDGIRQHDEDGNEYWPARELAPLLDYPQWRNFVPVLEKAREACRNSGQPVEDHFADMRKMVDIKYMPQRFLAQAIHFVRAVPFATVRSS
ncbi:MAG: hypothetical protein WBP11_07645 [Dokdonella sp.]